MSYTIRTATTADLGSLGVFFRKAYGEDTVFRDGRFLRWWFAGGPAADGPLRCAVAVAPDGDIAAHYGFLRQRLVLPDGSTSPLDWGVNAYTLAEHRRRGLGEKLLAHLLPREGFFGVIGFTPQAAGFYEKAGFNLFGRRRFKRFMLLLDDAVLEIALAIGVAREKILPFLGEGRGSRDAARGPASPHIRLLTSADHVFPAPRPGLVRAGRDRAYLKWRFFDNPLVRYEVYGWVEGGEVKAYAVMCREALKPTAHCASRIVDLEGDDAHASRLVEHCLAAAARRGDAYLDFGVFGTRFDAVFRDLGFSLLSEDDAALLPQVCDPIEGRPNGEYLGLYSASEPEVLRGLGESDILFTRADSDRDRAARIPVEGASS